MGLLTAAGNSAAKTNYPLAAFPATDMQSMYPLSVWHWTKQPDAASIFVPFALNDAVNNGFDTYYNGTSGGAYVAEQYNNPADGAAFAYRAPVVDVWQGWGGLYSSAASRTIFAPDGSAASDAASVAGSVVLSNLRMASFGATTHALAEFAAWNAELGADDFARLRAGANPAAIRPDRLLWYFPLRGDVRDYGPLKLPVTGVGTWDQATAAFTDHPAVSPPHRRRWLGNVRPRRRPMFVYS